MSLRPLAVMAMLAGCTPAPVAPDCFIKVGKSLCVEEGIDAEIRTTIIHNIQLADIELFYSRESVRVEILDDPVKSKCKKTNHGYEIMHDRMKIQLQPTGDDPEYLRYAYSGLFFVDGTELLESCGI